MAGDFNIANSEERKNCAAMNKGLVEAYAGDVCVAMKFVWRVVVTCRIQECA